VTLHPSTLRCGHHGQRSAMTLPLDSCFDPNERKYYITPESVELAMKEPYNRIAKTKVTLAFVGLLYEPKRAFWWGDGEPENRCNPLKMRLTD
jgi:hypothetical protein